MKISTSTQVFITRIDTEVTPPVVGITNLKYVVWDATTGDILHQTESESPLLQGRHFHRSPALAFNTRPGGEYVLALMCSNSLVGNCTFHTDVSTTETANAITTHAQGGVQTTFAAPNTPPLMNGNFDVRMKIHGFILNDQDNDNVANDVDNCPFHTNTNQNDADGDGLGDACDSTTNDDDGDTVVNAMDNCPFVDNPAQDDGDGDGIGDECDNQDGNDFDADGDANADDNCPFDDNPDQADSDSDGIGDACDGSNSNPEEDDDGDGFDNGEDNCPSISNPDQSDSDSDGRGDECDLSIVVDGSGCSTSAGTETSFALMLFGLVLGLRRRSSSSK